LEIAFTFFYGIWGTCALLAGGVVIFGKKVARKILLTVDIIFFVGFVAAEAYGHYQEVNVDNNTFPVTLLARVYPLCMVGFLGVLALIRLCSCSDMPGAALVLFVGCFLYCAAAILEILFDASCLVTTRIGTCPFVIDRFNHHAVYGLIGTFGILFVGASSLVYIANPEDSMDSRDSLY
jgi:hypothetical protein